MFFLTWPPGAAVGVPPASWTGLTSSWDTVGMLGHVFDHQPPLTRPLQAVDAACSTTIAWKYCQKSLKINGNQWKPMEINENQWKSMKNQWKSMKNQWKSMKILDLELEQAATTASLGRQSVAWWPNAMPGKPTVSQDHVRTVQQAGGRPTAAPGGRQVPCKNKTIY